MSRIFRGDQQGDLWQKARVGRITGSRIDDLLASPTTRQSTRKGIVYPAGSEAQCREHYRRELVVERIYGRAIDHPTNQYMRDGTDREPAARALYEADNMIQVEQVSFCLHYEWDWAGCSPDGLVGDDGGLELKCPSESVHDSYAQNIDVLVQQYKGQCLAGLICLPERQWWDLQSFNPYAPREIMLLKAPRFHRSDWAETIARIEDEMLQMNAQVEAEIAKRGLPPTQWMVMP
ncbi:YqaJ viral recombinase family protein [Patescibacteria group bacterium]|nr:YqaJ viral recombinase family protein [Patescibacteria group bacterium]